MVKSLKEIEKVVKWARAEGKIIVTTNGAFDLLHVGHLRSLTKAKSLGDILIVGVNSDASVRTHKDKSRPIITAKKRAKLVAALKPVDYVFIFNEPDPRAWLKILKPHIHAKGSDRSLSQIIERTVVKKSGGKVVRIPLEKGLSTTAIIKKIIG